MHQTDVAALFEQHRGRLRAVAFQMLGSLPEAEDAVQETWLRLSGTDVDAIDNAGGWLTTVLSRICLNLLRARRVRGELPLALDLVDFHVPDPLVSTVADPEHEALLAESVGLAMFVVLDTLVPAERLALVLHDVFAVPFADIASIIDSTPAAARQFASRARRRVQRAPTPDVDLAGQREVVDAFFTAARKGDFDALLAVLDPDVVLRSDGGPSRASASVLIRGGTPLASRAIGFADPSLSPMSAVINGTAGVVVVSRRGVMSVMGFVIRGGRVAEIDVLADPERLRRLELMAWG